MDSVAVAFWGAFFGTVTLLLVAALLVFTRSARRVAWTAALSAAMAAVFTLAFVGWLPLDPAALLRVQAQVAPVCAAVLGLLLLSMLGLLRDRRFARGAAAGAAVLVVAVLLGGWLVGPEQAFLLSSAMTLCVALAAVVTAAGSALRGVRQARQALAAVAFMVVAVAGLSWIAWNRGHAPWPLHALSAVSGMAFLTTMASVLWERHSYLIELRQVMIHGPSYDPVTRMRSHAESGAMVVDAFNRRADDPRPLGVVVISIANLYALEQLHGRAAANHALFVCASRLRRCVPPHVEMGRLAQDGFLLVMRHPRSGRLLAELAQQVAERLARPLEVGTTHDLRSLEATRTKWVAEIGIGVLQAPPELRPSSAVAMGRAMSRTAWSYVSRIAWFDPKTEQIAELPSAI